MQQNEAAPHSSHTVETRRAGRRLPSSSLSSLTPLGTSMSLRSFFPLQSFFCGEVSSSRRKGPGALKVASYFPTSCIFGEPGQTQLTATRTLGFAMPILSLK